MTLTTLKSILAAVFAALQAFDIPGAPTAVRVASISGASLVIATYIFRAHPTAGTVGQGLDSILRSFASGHTTPTGATQTTHIPGT